MIRDMWEDIVDGLLSMRPGRWKRHAVLLGAELRVMRAERVDARSLVIDAREIMLAMRAGRPVTTTDIHEWRARADRWLG
jgi:hypothetical protein